MSALTMSKDVEVESTAIPGLLIVHLDVRADARGWFAETWQREKMTAAGMPDFVPVQANLAVSRRGTTRGLHAEPWDKLVTIAAGRVFAAWVDVRPGPRYGATHATMLGPGVSVFIPRGVANGYQAQVDDTAYAYLVNDHWRADVEYAAIDLRDPALDISWPLPIDEALVSDRDRTASRLPRVTL